MSRSGAAEGAREARGAEGPKGSGRRRSCFLPIRDVWTLKVRELVRRDYGVTRSMGSRGFVPTVAQGSPLRAVRSASLYWSERCS